MTLNTLDGYTRQHRRERRNSRLRASHGLSRKVSSKTSFLLLHLRTLSSPVRLLIFFTANPTDDLRKASCCNEAFKIATSSAAYLNNYFMLIGTDGVYSFTFEHQKRDDCPVCGGQALDVTINKEWTLERLIEMLIERQDV